MPDGPSTRKKRWWSRWRTLLRALHRDVGYLALGLTVVYALSGIAVNHIADWDPNFVNYEREFQLETPLPNDDDEAAAVALAHVGDDGPALDVYRVDERELEVVLEERTLHIDTTTGHVVEEGQRERVFLRLANWLHLNRGKKSWTYIADGYAVFLLYLALSGMFMLPGKKGLRGRGAILIAIGLLAPVLYVHFSGGP